MAMGILRKLTEGLASWIHYEYCCDRSDMFSEKYLSAPTGGILTSLNMGRVFAEFEHPALSRTMVGRGKRPAIDFAVCGLYPTPTIAIETKWVSEKGLNVELILWDLIRLALISKENHAQCFFLMGGRREDLESVFIHPDFSGATGGKHATPILNSNSNAKCGLYLTPNEHWRHPILRSAFQGWPDGLSCSQRISTRRTEPFPSKAPRNQYQIIGWEIAHIAEKGEFFPATNFYYR